jgi:hypothetical protein
MLNHIAIAHKIDKLLAHLEIDTPVGTYGVILFAEVLSQQIIELYILKIRHL